jgi:hypothetical protein
MSDSKPLYERLTRPRFGLNGTGSLWLGKDHLLLVNNAFAVERYRRWYFSDLQAIVMRRTSMRLIWNLILGALALILIAGAGGCLYGSATSTNGDDVMVLAVMAAFFGVIGFGFAAAAMVNTAMGPSCALFVQTPHGLDRLTTPNRVMAVERLTARFQPSVLAAQTPGGNQGDTLHQIAAALDQPLQ